jgi:tetratricopeptide (TPR) repeat protein
MQKYHKARVDYGAAMQEHEKALKAFQEKTEKNDHDGAKESHELAFQKYTEAQKLVHEMREAQKQAKTYADKHTRDNEFTIFPKEVGGGHRGGSPRGRFGPFPWEKEWPENTTFHAWEVTKLADRIQKMGDSTKSWPGKGDHIESLKCEQEREKAANAYAEALQTHHGAHQAMNKERADFHLKRAQEHRAKIEEHHRKAEGKRPRCGPGCKWHGPHHRH